MPDGRGPKMKPNWKNIGKVGASIAAIAIFNGVVMSFAKPPVMINIAWSAISGGIVGFLAVMKWDLFSI
jgi:hypothetical protein